MIARDDTAIRIAAAHEYADLRHAYGRWGYDGGILADDRVYVAEERGAYVGIVRRTREEGVTMLRGMQVAPECQRRGIGRKLLTAFSGDLGAEACYCIPYDHLTGFYGLVGFAPVAESDAPEFLRARLETYRSQGLRVLVMCRSHGGRDGG